MTASHLGISITSAVYAGGKSPITTAEESALRSNLSCLSRLAAEEGLFTRDTSAEVAACPGHVIVTKLPHLSPQVRDLVLGVARVTTQVAMAQAVASAAAEDLPTEEGNAWVIAGCLRQQVATLLRTAKVIEAASPRLIPPTRLSGE